MFKISYFSFCLIPFFSFSQNPLVEKANLQYRLLEFSNAIKNYEIAISEGEKSEIIYKNLANCYYNIAQFEKAVFYYTLLFNSNKKQDTDSFFKFSESLKANEKYSQANEILREFSKKYPRDLRAKLFLENPNYLDTIHKNSSRYKIDTTSINTKNIEYGGFVNQNKFYFTAYKLGDKNLDKWTNQSYSRIYVAPIDSLKNIGKPQLLFPENNRAGNESSPVLTKDGKTIYFTRNDQEKISTIEDEKSYFLKIYKASLIDNKWQNIEELPFCSNTFNTANPALSPDEHTLYFASDRPETNGQSDIYKVIIYYDGSYSKPINLKLINTSSKENFPFISKENILYFSSNGHLGLGGLDIYSFDFKTNTLKNLGDKINSSQDDFSIFIDDKYGFLSSNRIGGNGFDDIYKFSIIEEGQITQKKEIATKFPVEIGNDLAKKIALKPIYFDLNKWDIRTDASLEIDKIFEIMNKYPSLIIAINAHTDCRNSEEYNQILSQKRADETRNYLISKGINATRLIAKGFGEFLLLNTCKDGENCTEEEHQQNRRSEFIVVQF